MPTIAITSVESSRQQWDGTTFNEVVHSHVSAFNPIVVEFQRKDKDGVTFSQSSVYDTSKYAFRFSEVNGELFAGDYVYINASFLVGTFLILDFDSVTGEFTIDEPYVSDVTGFINTSSRLNWYLTLRMNGTGGQYREVRLTPDETGFIRAEISGMAKSFISLDTSVEFLPSSDPSYQINLVDTNLSKVVNLTWRENWVGSDEAFTENSPGENQFYIHAGVFQIGDPSNGYYSDYLANFSGSNSFRDFLPGWLTMFPKPVYFIGYPMTVSALMGKNLGALSDYRLDRVLRDTTNGSIGSQNIDLESLTQGMINLFDVNYNDIDATILDSMSLRLKKLTGGDFILKWLELSVVRTSEQHCNAMYLRWLNPLGGWDYYLFQNRLIETDKVESIGTYETYFDSIAEAKDYQNFIGKRTTTTIQVGLDSVSNNDLTGIRYLKTSPKVYWYNTAISKWIGVRVEVGSFQFRETQNKYSRVELSIMLPTQLNQTA